MRRCCGAKVLKYGSAKMDEIESSDPMTVARLVLVLLVAGISAPALAQTAAPPRPQIVASPLAVAPTIDGNVVGDDAWAGVAAGGDFRQTTPDEGEPASERTDVRIGFTKDTLYIAVVCYDRTPSAIIASEARRDAPLDDSDSIRVILDTFHDQQNGFVFGTNPNALEYDGQVTNEGQGGSIVLGGAQAGSGGGFNLNWDASWSVRTSVTEIGWSAEFAIPFRTLRYPAGDTQQWGINFQRTIRRRNEVAYWSPLPRQFTLFRLSQAGTVVGLQIPSQRNLKLTPYALGRTSYTGRTSDESSASGDVGGDLKYSLTPSMTLDATINTDFAQVEVDEFQINLDRFNLFYPEKRPFFLENAGLFAVGSPAEVELFFSRRIGIGDDGEVIPIVGGARVSGQVKGVNIGLLNMQTDSFGAEAANNFTVARVRKDLPNRSNIGAIVVNREGTGSLSGPDDYNRSLAVDGRAGIGKYAFVSAFAARTVTPDSGDDAGAYEVRAERDSRALLLTSTFTSVGRDFNPEVGFLSRNGGFRKGEALVFYRYRPTDFHGLQEIRPHTSYRGYWDRDGFQQTGFAHFDSHWEWKNGYELHTGFNLTREGVSTPFEIYPGVIVPRGTYDEQETQIVLYTPRAKAVNLQMTVRAGGFFGGDRVALTPALKIRMSEDFNAEVNVTRNDVDLPGGSFYTTLARARLSYSFTPRMFVQGLVQYNDKDDLWSTNLRFGWLQQANTGLFVVYTDLHTLIDDDLVPRPQDGTDRTLVIKFSRMFDVLN